MAKDYVTSWEERCEYFALQKKTAPCNLNNKYLQNFKFVDNSSAEIIQGQTKKQNNNAMTTTKYKPVQIAWSNHSVQKDNEKLGEI